MNSRLEFSDLLAIIRDNGGDAQEHTFDGGESVIVAGLGLTAPQSVATSYWGDAQTATERMADRLAGLGLPGMAERIPAIVASRD